MTHISLTKGLNIPIKGKPSGAVHDLSNQKPERISLDVNSFDDVKFKLLVKPGDQIKIGQPVLEDKSTPNRMFCSPAAGTVQDFRRGLRRRLLDVLIDVASHEEQHTWDKLNVQAATREQLVSRLLEGGMFAHIRSRPFNILANPNKIPRDIFVKALESAPFLPPAELQVAGQEEAFQAGLDALSKLTSGAVHLVYFHNTTCTAFTGAKNVQHHTAEGPHPIANASVHIEAIAPIRSSDDVIWTLTVHDVICIGHLLITGHYYINRIISIAGPGVLADKSGYYKIRSGVGVKQLISGRIQADEPQRFISGDPLMGKKVEESDFMGFDDFALTVIPEGSDREFLHFFRAGKEKYSFSRAYVSGHLNNAHRQYDFTTNQHGEHRAFVDSSLYDKVMPLPVSTMLLVKAVMAEDFDLAEELGLLIVDSEDFALPTFVCPSKMEMVDIMKTGLKRYANDVS